jgi:RNA 3'-terminal phosphate cyclase (ATP)
MIEINGAEGGGSVLRVGVGLSAALGVPVRVVNIRGARKDPGLKHQHLAGLLATARLCNAQLEGAQFGSREIAFLPKAVAQSKLSVDIPTAGAVGLVLQPLQMACTAAGQEIEIHLQGGGTLGKWAPPLPYLEHVNFALLCRAGYLTQVDTERHGFYPKGGARVRARFYPSQIRGPLHYDERGSLKTIQGLSFAAQALRAARVAERQAQAAHAVLVGTFPEVSAYIEPHYLQTASIGSAVVLWASFEKTILGADQLGERGVPSERIGQRAAEKLITELRSQATLDIHMADQIIPFLALFGGSFRCREITDHIRINMAIAEQITQRHFAQRDGRVICDAAANAI